MKTNLIDKIQALEKQNKELKQKIEMYSSIIQNKEKYWRNKEKYWRNK